VAVSPETDIAAFIVAGNAVLECPALATRPESTDDVLRAEKLSREFQGRKVLDGLDLGLEGGARVAVTGPNGSGKTTLLRCIAGTLTPTSGRVLVRGHAAGTLEARALTGVSLAQERSFYLRLSGRTNLRFFARLRQQSRRRAEREVDALEEELGLREIASERCDRCSTGMMQQLAFARALLGGPELLLLDEPTRSLDDAAAERLWGALERRPAVAVLLATHDAGDIARCDSRLELGARP
jgi:ABC-2 type transport system ATP-binding protein